MEEILKKLNDIDKRLDSIENHTQKMSDHIDHINTVYVNVKPVIDTLKSTFYKKQDPAK